MRVLCIWCICGYAVCMFICPRRVVVTTDAVVDDDNRANDDADVTHTHSTLSQTYQIEAHTTNDDDDNVHIQHVHTSAVASFGASWSSRGVLWVRIQVTYILHVPISIYIILVYT